MESTTFLSLTTPLGRFARVCGAGAWEASERERENARHNTQVAQNTTQGLRIENRIFGADTMFSPRLEIKRRVRPLRRLKDVSE